MRGYASSLHLILAELERIDLLICTQVSRARHLHGTDDEKPARPDALQEICSPWARRFAYRAQIAKTILGTPGNTPLVNRLLRRQRTIRHPVARPSARSHIGAHSKAAVLLQVADWTGSGPLFMCPYRMRFQDDFVRSTGQQLCGRRLPARRRSTTIQLRFSTMIFAQSYQRNIKKWLQQSIGR
jgi:hypothetical protein